MLQLSRTRLTAGDPDRNFVHVHARSGDLSPTAYKLGNVTVSRQSLLAGEDDNYPTYFGVLRIPDGTPPGTYAVDVGRGPEAKITVIAPYPVKAALIAAERGDSAEQAQKALDKGANVLTFQVGIHLFDRHVVVNQPGVAVYAYGATLCRNSQNPVGDKRWLFDLTNAPDFSSYGLDVFYDQPSEVFQSNPTQTGLVLGNCKFRGCNLGFYHGGAFVRDCEFINAGAVIAPSGVWLRDTFTGRGLQDPFSFWGNLGPMATLELSFVRTRRGLCYNAANGPISDVLHVGTLLRDVCATPNGNESFLCEGGPLNRANILRTRASGCLGAVLQLDQGGDGGLVDDLAVTGGLGINLDGPATNWVVSNFELRDAGIWAPGATSCTFGPGSVIWTAPTRANQNWNNPSPGLLGRTAACCSGDPSNVLTGVNLWTAPWQGQTGFTVRD